MCDACIGDIIIVIIIGCMWMTCTAALPYMLLIMRHVYTYICVPSSVHSPIPTPTPTPTPKTHRVRWSKSQ